MILQNNIHLPIYLDYMATTPVDPLVAKKMQSCLTLDGKFGNPASKHSYGFEAKAIVEEARLHVANLVNANPRSIVWTSGATEAINLALKGAAFFYQRQGKHIITVKTEHKAVLDTCKYLEQHGFTVTYLNPEADGLINLDKLAAEIRQDTILLSVMHVNNEIGVIQNIAAIGEVARKKGILFHVDAAQSIGKIPIDLKSLKVDLMSFSAHKIYGPKGVGALYVRQEPRLHLEPQMHGGAQEFGLRSGTLATHQICGMGEALRIAKTNMQTEYQNILKLRNQLWDGIKNLPNIHLNGSFEQRIPNNLNVSFGGIDAGVLISGLKDLAISTSAACIKDATEPSYVLKALGVKSELATNTMRFSLGRFTTKDEIDYTIKHINHVVKALQKNY